MNGAESHVSSPWIALILLWLSRRLLLFLKRNALRLLTLLLSVGLVILLLCFPKQPLGHPDSPLRPPAASDDVACTFQQALWNARYHIKPQQPCSDLFQRHVVPSTVIQGAAHNNELLHPALKGTCLSKKDCPLVWVSMGSRCSKGFTRLATTVTRAGIPFAIIGFPAPWRGFGYRIRIYHDYLLTLPDDSLIVMSDGDDVMMTRCKAEDIVNAYNELNKTIVFNSESWCWPDGHRWYEFPEVPKPPLSSGGVLSTYRYLNAGAVIGTAAALRQFLAEAYTLESSDCADDQRVLAANFLNHYHRSSSAEDMSVSLDYYQRLFMTLQGHTLADFQVDTIRGSVRNRLINSSPCILHQNGWKGDSKVLEEVASLLKVDEW